MFSGILAPRRPPPYWSIAYNHHNRTRTIRCRGQIIEHGLVCGHDQACTRAWALYKSGVYKIESRVLATPCTDALDEMFARIRREFGIMTRRGVG